MWVRLVGIVGAILYGVGCIWAGLAQQRVGMAADALDCTYRTQLLRDRVLALTERSPRQSSRDPQDDVVFTLIRETRAVCAKPDATQDPQSRDMLDGIEVTLAEHRRFRAQEAKARRAVLAL